MWWKFNKKRFIGLVKENIKKYGFSGNLSDEKDYKKMW